MLYPALPSQGYLQKHAQNRLILRRKPLRHQDRNLCPRS